MSMARVKYVTKSRKPVTCEKCRTDLPIGSAYRWFKIGFRSRYEHKRCMASECSPKSSELESSNMRAAYEAQEAFEDAIRSAETVEDIEQARDDYAAALQDLADEYRDASLGADGYTVFNITAEERADGLEAAVSEVESIDCDAEEIDCDEPDCENGSVSGDAVSCEACDGSGSDENDDDCVECEGSGEITEEVDCEKCEGSGQMHDIEATRDRVLGEVMSVDFYG